MALTDTNAGWYGLGQEEVAVIFNEEEHPFHRSRGPGVRGLRAAIFAAALFAGLPLLRPTDLPRRPRRGSGGVARAPGTLGRAHFRLRWRPGAGGSLVRT